MASVNKIIIVGNLGKDPEIRTLPNGDQVANASIATTDKWKDKQTGEQREHTEWHRVVFNGKLAGIAGQYLRKGSQVYVEGSIRTRKWTDQATGQDRYSTEVRADSMQMLGKREGGDSGGYGGGNQGGYQQQGGGNSYAQASRGGSGNYGQQQRGNVPTNRDPYEGGEYVRPAQGQAQQQRPAQQPNQQPQGQQYQPLNTGGGFADMSDDIPF